MNKERKNLSQPNEREQRNAKIIVFSVFLIVILHTIYMNIMGFNFLSHEACLVYKSVPRWFFYLYENILELFIVIVIGLFAGVLTEKYFLKIKRFYPRNQILAFLYGSILPICSCGVIPLIDSMKKITSLKVIITFIIATPLLNPYILFLSYAVLGLKFTILRVIFSFFTAMITGQILQFAANKFKLSITGDFEACVTDCNPVMAKDPFVKTIRMTRKILPYILFAGILSFVFAMINPMQYIEPLNLKAEPWTSIIMTLVGIPIYVCNGTDVLFLKPLLEFTDLSMGAAIAFSLSSSALCISSIVMLAKFLGTKLTTILIVTIFVLMILFSSIINYLI